jgi:hypothetical protein
VLANASLPVSINVPARNGINNINGNNSLNTNIIDSSQYNNSTNNISSANDVENQSDKIELSNENAINVVKAKDVFSETLSDFKSRKFGYYGDMTGPLTLMDAVMQAEGKSSIDFSSNSNMSFVNYVDDLTETAKEHSDLVPSNFLDFCSELKSNLEKAHCK